jgi:aspartate/methionine/tyrosine aminotransferase
MTSSAPWTFAVRSNWDLSTNPLSLELERLEKEGVGVIDLTESNPTRAGFDYSHGILLDPFLSADNLVYSPDPRGLLRARQAVSDDYARKGVNVQLERLWLTSSTSEAYSFIFKLLLEPGERVLVPAPSYPLFSYLAGLHDVQVDYYPLVYNGSRWSIDLEALEAAFTPAVRAIIVVSPNNPTGSLVSVSELEALNRLCLDRRAAVICDEVFSDYLIAPAPDACKTLAGNSQAPTFVLGGLSKSLALPQMKLSWIAVNGPADFLGGALARLEMIADTYLSVSAPVQNACGSWLARGEAIRSQVMGRLQRNYSFLREEAAHGGKAVVLPVEGGWYAVMKVAPGMPVDEWVIRLLRQRHILVHPGFYYDFDGDGYVVISLLPRPDIFDRGVRDLWLEL